MVIFKEPQFRDLLISV